MMRSLLALITVPLLSACSPAPGADATGSAGPASPPALTATDTAAGTTTAAPASAAPSSPPGQAATVASAASASADPPALPPGTGTGPSDVPEVVPGVSIGPVRLGMTRAELTTTGLWVRPFSANDPTGHTVLAGPYYIVLRDDRVDSIEAPLTQMPKGLRVRGKVLPWRTTLEVAAAAFTDCEPLQRKLGGNDIRCEGKRLLVKSGGGSGVIHVQIFATPALAPGEAGSP